jgi:hypothetical protein
MAQAKTKTKPKAKAKAPKSRSQSKPTGNGLASKANGLASKAKMPLVAGGAALAGAAGGLAIGARQARRHKVMGMVPRRPQVKVKSRDIRKAAKEVGSFGAQVGHLASELQQARESNGGRHRSPVEVVLEGLTARRSRA